MKRPLRLALFTHSLRSDWNNGNAHFLRGLASALARLGHRIECWEPESGWSLENLLRQEGEAGRAALADFTRAYPALCVRSYDAAAVERLSAELGDIDVAIVHEWNEPEVVAAILSARDRYGFRALFHDTHHRAASTPEQLRRLEIERFDGVLAFGNALRRIYRELWGIERVWTLHEAADTARPPASRPASAADVVWVGNWGDDERTRELDQFLMQPAADLPGYRFAVHGVRYPPEGIERLRHAGVEFRGYLPNLEAGAAYGAARVTVHIPRRQYAEQLPGIPTIRVFEALACGIPLVSAPWRDEEELFRRDDFRMVHTREQMTTALRELLNDAVARRQQAEAGRETVLRRHTCHHRAEQLTDICEELLA